MSPSAQRAPVYFLGAILALALIWLWAKPIAPRSDSEFRILPSQGAQLEQWLTPGLDLPNWTLDSGYMPHSYGTFLFTDKSGSALRLELHHVDAVTEALFRTDHFAIVHLEGSVDQELVDHLERNLKTNEHAWTWDEAEGDPTPKLFRRLLNLQIPVALLLLFLMPFCVFFAYRSAWTTFKETTDFPWRGLFLALLLAGFMRFGLAPLRMVVLYIGYDLTDAAITLDQIPRYGVGGSLFHHGILEVFGPDHRVVLWTHAFLGVITLPLLSCLVHRLFKSTSATLFFSFAWAILPMAVAHDTSEANTVPILWWLSAATILFLDGLERKAPWCLLGATVLAALCMVSRPEFGILVPAVFLALSFNRLKGELRWFLKVGWPLLLAALLLVLPQAVHVMSRASLLMDSQSLPLGSSSAFNQVSFFDPYLTPFALWPFFLLALLWRRRWAETLPWVLLFGLATALTWADLCPANIARVQVPAVLFVMVVVSFGASRAFDWVQSRDWAQALKRGFVGAVLVGLLGSALPAIGGIWAPTHEDYEELLIREAAEFFEQNSAEPDALLVRLGYGDVVFPADGSVVHLHFPDYLFGGVGLKSRVRGVGEWVADLEKDAPAYFLLSVRCYTPETPVRTIAPLQMPMRRVCQEILDEFGAEAVFEYNLEALGDAKETGYYGRGTRHSLRLGLYRLHP